MIELTTEQRTPEWYKERLGRFSASQIGKLLGKTDLKASQPGKNNPDGAQVFGDTAKAYIYRIAAERAARRDWDEKTPDQIDDYLRVTSVDTREVRWGVQYEDAAKMAFELATGYNVRTPGTCTDESRDYLSASPDGIIEGGEALIEIKCPQFEKFGRYTEEVMDGETLKEVNADYYWQIQTQLFVTGAKCCYFVWYHPWFPLQYARIERDNEDIMLMLNRVDAAEKIAARVCTKVLGNDKEI